MDRVAPTSIALNACLSACEKAAQWQLALRLLRAARGGAAEGTAGGVGGEARDRRHRGSYVSASLNGPAAAENDRRSQREQP